MLSPLPLSIFCPTNTEAPLMSLCHSGDSTVCQSLLAHTGLICEKKPWHVVTFFRGVQRGPPFSQSSDLSSLGTLLYHSSQALLFFPLLS